MSESSEVIKNLLNDPAVVEKISAVLEQLQNTSAPADDSQSKLDSEIEPITTQLVSKIKNSQHDSKLQLLLALKPYMSERRASKMDGIIKLLRITNVIGAMNELNLFK